MKNKSIRVQTLASFCEAFGSIGLQGGCRRKRTQEDKEWFVMRRFLHDGIIAGYFQLPLTIEKSNPPAPDFTIQTDAGQKWIEITEATSQNDQQEMTEFERSKKPAMLLGDFGGRPASGLNNPEQPWASGVIDAIKRKETKTIFSSHTIERHLVIYPNSNASNLILFPEREPAAFVVLFDLIQNHKELTRIVNGCTVHVLGKWHVGFDLLVKKQIIERHKRDL